MTAVRRKTKESEPAAVPAIPQIDSISPQYAYLRRTRLMIASEMDELRRARVAIAAKMRSDTRPVAELRLFYSGPLGLRQYHVGVRRFDKPAPERAEPTPITQAMRDFAQKIREVLPHELVDRLLPADPPPPEIEPGPDGLKQILDRERVLEAALVIVSGELESARLRASAIAREQVRPAYEAARERLIAQVFALRQAQSEFWAICDGLTKNSISWAMLGPLEISHLMTSHDYDLFTRACKREGLLAELPPPVAVG